MPDPSHVAATAFAFTQSILQVDLRLNLQVDLRLKTRRSEPET
jgi:hypothetical protein